MASYLRPGVFVEETLQALTDPSTNSGESTAAFVGVSNKGGPVGATLVTSWSNFQSLYGDLRGSTDELSFAVYQFFVNGGSRCYVSRVVAPDAVAASATLLGVADNTSTTEVDESEASVKVIARAAGSWGNTIYVTTSVSQDTTRFNLTVELRQNGTDIIAREIFNDLSMDPMSDRNAVSVVNSPVVGSKYVTLALPSDYTSFLVNQNPLPITTALSGGLEGTAVDLSTTNGRSTFFSAVEELDVVDVLLVVNLPGVGNPDLLNQTISWAQESRSRFIVIDTPEPLPSDTRNVIADDAVDFVTDLTHSSFAAVYGPWVFVSDPSVGTRGALRLAPPGGGVLGQFMRTDTNRGESKAPAGTGTVMSVVGPQVQFTDTQLDTLNQNSVNVIRTLRSVGTCIMGARTLNVGYPDRYVNVRRGLMRVAYSLTEQTRYSVFEPNNSVLWDSLRAVCEQWLTNYWSAGNLSGTSPEEAFYVKCDSEINSPSSINAGIVNVEIGVALASPAEFIVLRIGQFDGGSSITESGV